MTNVVWSYSSLNTFKQCPKKYYHLKIAKDVKDEGSTATRYGQTVHTIAEEFIRDGVDIPPAYEFMRKYLEPLQNLEGDKFCEQKLGLKLCPENKYAPCGFYAKDVWWRGIADLVVVNGPIAYSIDYKTSKNARYADTKQLDAVAAAVFTHYPEVDTIRSMLMFVVADEQVKKTHYREHRDSYLEAFTPDLDRLAKAQETDVWNANTGPLCRFCPVTDCANHPGKRKSYQ